jgi:Ran GTPase-activating protein (RanGAP) involved in mRNA processing and transport
MESSKRRRLQNNELTRIDCDDENAVTDIVDILQNQPNHSSLKEICIRCAISIDNARLIANVFKINKSIVALECGMNTICSDGIAAIVGALSHCNNTTLTKLDLHGNIINDTAVVAIGHMLKTNNSLTVLNISLCGIDSDGAIVIGDSLKYNTTLERLELTANEIGDVGTVAIADGIKENDSSSLNSLVFWGDGIGITGARSIAAMLMTSKSLMGLNLGNNAMIATEGVVAISYALKQSESLMTLDLSAIPFGDDGAKSIASMLTTNCSLMHLGMGGCGIRDDGAAAIAVSLRTNKSLTYLDLRHNPINNSVIANELAPMLEINTALKDLSLGDHNTPMDNAAARSLLRALEDYNDTVNICMACKLDCIKDIEDKINIISKENCEGIRCAPLNRRRIFNRLNVIWITRTHDT